MMQVALEFAKDSIEKNPLVHNTVFERRYAASDQPKVVIWVAPGTAQLLAQEVVHASDAISVVLVAQVGKLLPKDIIELLVGIKKKDPLSVWYKLHSEVSLLRKTFPSMLDNHRAK